jgi:6-phosphogluconate dehydrogenase
MAIMDDELHAVYSAWTPATRSAIYCKKDEQTVKRLIIDVILDEAKQKGTGPVASQDAWTCK